MSAACAARPPVHHPGRVSVLGERRCRLPRSGGTYGRLRRPGNLTARTTVAGAASKYLVTSSSYSPTAGAGVTITAQLADANNNPVATSGNKKLLAVDDDRANRADPTRYDTGSKDSEGLAGGDVPSPGSLISADGDEYLSPPDREASYRFDAGTDIVISDDRLAGC